MGGGGEVSYQTNNTCSKCINIRHRHYWLIQPRSRKKVIVGYHLSSQQVKIFRDCCVLSMLIGKRGEKALTKGLFTWRRGPQVGEVTCGGSPDISCKRDQNKMRDYMTGGLPHLSVLPHLPAVPHVQVNRPL